MSFRVIVQTPKVERLVRGKAVVVGGVHAYDFDQCLDGLQAAEDFRKDQMTDPSAFVSKVFSYSGKGKSRKAA